MPLVYKTLIPIIAFLIGTTLVVGAYFRDSLVNTLFAERFLDTKEAVESAARDLSLAESAVLPEDPESRVRFARFVERVKDSSTARITLWDTDARVVFSDLSTIEGAVSPGNASLSRARAEAFFVEKELDDGIPLQSAVGPFLDIYVPIRASSGAIAIVEIHAIQGALLAPLTQGLNNAGYLILIGLAVLALFIILLFRFFILDPLNVAGALARKVSAGDFTAYPIRAGKDEIGDLFENLDRMRTQLAAQVGTLESTVAQRTHELREEETRLAASLGSLSVGFVIFDTDGNVFYQNQAAKKLFGAPRPVTLASIADAFAGVLDVRALYRDCIALRAITDEKAVSVGPQFFRMFLAPVVMDTEEERVLGAVLLLEDVTEAKALDRAKDDFLSIASHELRTPLAAIRLNAELLKGTLKQESAGAEAISMIEDIHIASLRLIKIVHDFLDIAALEQHIPVRATDEVDVGEMARDVIEQLGNLAKEKKLALTLTKLPKELPKALADAERLKQVLVNLVGNAIRYTEKGRVEVSCAYEASHIVIRVKDTGVGIPPEFQGLLFKKFQQANVSVMTRAHSQGTGLGLYISRLIMESMGGTLALESSAYGKGSVFALTIPQARYDIGNHA